MVLSLIMTMICCPYLTFVGFVVVPRDGAITVRFPANPNAVNTEAFGLCVCVSVYLVAKPMLSLNLPVDSSSDFHLEGTPRRVRPQPLAQPATRETEVLPIEFGSSGTPS
jgi:hypothetical protein|eukprot:COSAG01_NODE_15147_length_1368_cov_5.231678_3_plen_110_part_00